MKDDLSSASINISDHACPQCSGLVTIFARPRKGDAKKYIVLYCGRCRLGETFPKPDDAVINELHSTEYYRNGEGARFVGPVEWMVDGMRRWRIRRLLNIIKIGRALDIGCGSGRFLRGLRGYGWSVAGLELNDETAMSARKNNGLSVETSLDVFDKGSFDLITITHVLEHIRDPQQVLQRCAELLRGGGVLAVAVPNIESWQARFSREEWFHLDLPRHLWHFSEAWLLKQMSGLGFTVLKVRRLDLAHNIFGWMQSLLNLTGLHHNRLYSFLSSDDFEKSDNPRAVSLLLSVVMSPLLLPISIILAVLEAALHEGGTVEIIAMINHGGRQNPGG
jgi:SAM-dependent methyltransferase